jgi:AraC family transcriptional activator of tynA and feaB
MAEQFHVESVDVWHEVICAHVLEAQCVEIGPDFKVDFTISRNPEAQLSRVRSVAHRWQRLEKHLRNSSQDSVVFCLQLSGSAVHIQDGREIILRPGDISCSDTTRPLEMKLPGAFEQLLVHVPRPVITAALGPTQQFTALELSQRTPVGSVLASFLRSVNSVLDHVSEPAAEQLSTIAASLIVATLAEQSELKLDHPSWPKHALLYRAQLYMQQNFRNPDLTPTLVAAALKVSVRYLQTIFQELGKTPSEYLWGCRLEGSKKDLENPAFAAMSISDVAWRNGFIDLSHFSTRFKQAFDATPRELRQRALIKSSHAGSKSVKGRPAAVPGDMNVG